MPLPLLAILGIGAVGALGVGKTVKAAVDQKDAKDFNEYAQDLIDNATKKADESRKNSGDAIDKLGECKIKILDGSVKSFVESFEKLRNVELTASEGLNELNKMKIDKQSLQELKELSIMASTVLGGAASGAVIGAATAWGAYGAVMTWGAASTGAKIAVLAGIAKTNATLAFLGGGALSAGGLGIAGGTAILGGLVAAPALAVFGFVMGAKASANKDAALSNVHKAREFCEEMETLRVTCKGIRMRAAMFERLLLKLNTMFEPMIYNLEKTIETCGTDFSQYTPEQRKNVAACLALAGAVKAVLDTPILTEDGKLTAESEKISDKVVPALKTAHA